MNDTNEKLIKKIQNLFNLAEGNSNQNEAQQALLTAQRLMAKNGIELSEVEGFNSIKPKEILEDSAVDYKRLFWWEKNLGSVIGKNFRCEVFTRSSGRGMKKLMFLGLKDDVVLAKMVYGFACRSLEHNTVKFTTNFKTNFPKRYNVGVKNDYTRGWIRGLENSYANQVKQNDWGLVLVKDPLVQSAVDKLRLRNTKANPIRSDANAKAFSKGFDQGKKFASPSGMIK